MARPPEFTIEYRLGRDRATEWRFTASAMQKEFTDLQSLNHRFLCGFLIGPELQSLSIRRHAPVSVFSGVINFLRARPSEYVEYLRQVNAEPFPAEVLEGIWRHFRPEEFIRDTWCPDHPWMPDPMLISAFPKGGFQHSADRGTAWALTMDYSKSIGVDTSVWRKCHTKNYWAWFASATPRTTGPGSRPARRQP